MKRILIALLGALLAMPAAGAVYPASDGPGLTRAARTAQSCSDVIELAAGTYPLAAFKSTSTTSMSRDCPSGQGVTIQPAAGAQVTIAGVQFVGVSGWRLAGLRITPAIGSKGQQTVAVDVQGGSNIEVSGSDLRGADCSAAAIRADFGSRPFNTKGGTDIRFRGNVMGCTGFGGVFAGTDGLLIEGSTVTTVNFDHLKGYGRHVTIRNNRLRDQLYTTNDHADCIQFWTTGLKGQAPIDGIHIQDNECWRTTSASSDFMGISVRDEAGIGYTDVVISGNVISTDNGTCISVSGATGAVISGNYCRAGKIVLRESRGGVLSGNVTSTPVSLYKPKSPPTTNSGNVVVAKDAMAPEALPLAMVRALRR